MSQSDLRIPGNFKDAEKTYIVGNNTGGFWMSQFTLPDEASAKKLAKSLLQDKYGEQYFYFIDGYKYYITL